MNKNVKEKDQKNTREREGGGSGIEKRRKVEMHGALQWEIKKSSAKNH